jgi:hypothetical protein
MTASTGSSHFDNDDWSIHNSVAPLMNEPDLQALEGQIVEMVALYYECREWCTSISPDVVRGVIRSKVQSLIQKITKDTDGDFAGWSDRIKSKKIMPQHHQKKESLNYNPSYDNSEAKYMGALETIKNTSTSATSASISPDAARGFQSLIQSITKDVDGQETDGAFAEWMQDIAAVGVEVIGLQFIGRSISQRTSMISQMSEQEVLKQAKNNVKGRSPRDVEQSNTNRKTSLEKSRIGSIRRLFRRAANDSRVKEEAKGEKQEENEKIAENHQEAHQDVLHDIQDDSRNNEATHIQDVAPDAINDVSLTFHTKQLVANENISDDNSLTQGFGSESLVISAASDSMLADSVDWSTCFIASAWVEAIETEMKELDMAGNVFGKSTATDRLFEKIMLDLHNTTRRMFVESKATDQVTTAAYSKEEEKHQEEKQEKQDVLNVISESDSCDFSETHDVSLIAFNTKQVVVEEEKGGDEGSTTLLEEFCSEHVDWFKSAIAPAACWLEAADDPEMKVANGLAGGSFVKSIRNESPTIPAPERLVEKSIMSDRNDTTRIESKDSGHDNDQVVTMTNEDQEVSTAASSSKRALLDEIQKLKAALAIAQDTLVQQTESGAPGGGSPNTKFGRPRRNRFVRTVREFWEAAKDKTACVDQDMRDVTTCGVDQDMRDVTTSGVDQDMRDFSPVQDQHSFRVGEKEVHAAEEATGEDVMLNSFAVDQIRSDLPPKPQMGKKKVIHDEPALAFVSIGTRQELPETIKERDDGDSISISCEMNSKGEVPDKQKEEEKVAVAPLGKAKPKKEEEKVDVTNEPTLLEGVVDDWSSTMEEMNVLKGLVFSGILTSTNWNRLAGTTEELQLEMANKRQLPNAAETRTNVYDSVLLNNWCGMEDATEEEQYDATEEEHRDATYVTTPAGAFVVDGTIIASCAMEDISVLTMGTSKKNERNMLVNKWETLIQQEMDKEQMSPPLFADSAVRDVTLLPPPVADITMGTNKKSKKLFGKIRRGGVLLSE